MGKLILTTEIPRKVGFLYYCGTDEKGNLTVNEAPLSRGGNKKKKK